MIINQSCISKIILPPHTADSRNLQSFLEIMNINRIKYDYYNFLKNKEIVQRRIFDHHRLDDFCRSREETDFSLINNNIYLFTQPRSGSHWLSDLLLTIPDSGLINEPLNVGVNFCRGRVPRYFDYPYARLRKLKFYFDQPIPANETWEEAFQFFKDLFCCTINAAYLYGDIEYDRLASIRSFVFKFCYGNLLLKWLIEQFSIRPLVLIRHPCATIASQLKLPDYRKALIRPEHPIPQFRYNDIFLEFSDIFKSLRTPEEILAARWALNWKAILDDPDQSKWYLVSYENLYLSFDKEIAGIFSWLALPVPENIQQQKNKPSYTTLFESVKHIKSGAQIDRWKKELSVKKQKLIIDTINRFRIEVYGDDVKIDLKRLTKQNR